ncbi:hypothetical protein FACS1894216_22520 [Synergistales bacterium]|nr:hypothetical protein FACS1894216_22520 [Synergistales bacterium]
MVEVAARREGANFSISAEGHSGFADAGSDIVCAAVSTLMEALVVGLEDVLEIDADAAYDPSIPRMDVEWNDSEGRALDIAKTIWLSIKGVEEAHPNEVKVIGDFSGEEE